MKFETTVIVNKKVTMGNVLARIACVVLLVLGIVTAFVTMMIPLVLLSALLGLVWYFLNLEAQSEYEYSYIEGTLSFAKIRAKSRRKTIAEMDMSEVILIAPSSAHELYNYHNNNQVTIRNCTSGDTSVPTYEVVYKRGDHTTVIVFEPDSEMLDTIRKRYPRQVMA